MRTEREITALTHHLSQGTSMKLKSLAVALAMMAGAPAMAACTDSFNLGAMGPTALRTIGNDFSSVQRFEDCYSFTLTNAADAFGLTLEFDGSIRRNIDLTSVTLTGGNLNHAITDTSAGSFSFSNLLAGVYQFVIEGNVTGTNGGLFGGGAVGYSGFFGTTASSSPAVAAPVPEPQTYALLALGLLAVGSVVRRRNSNT
jgi:hypothetical protein